MQNCIAFSSNLSSNTAKCGPSGPPPDQWPSFFCHHCWWISEVVTPQGWFEVWTAGQCDFVVSTSGQCLTCPPWSLQEWCLCLVNCALATTWVTHCARTCALATGSWNTSVTASKWLATQCTWVAWSLQWFRHTAGCISRFCMWFICGESDPKSMWRSLATPCFPHVSYLASHQQHLASTGELFVVSWSCSLPWVHWQHFVRLAVCLDVIGSIWNASFCGET